MFAEAVSVTVPVAALADTVRVSLTLMSFHGPRSNGTGVNVQLVAPRRWSLYGGTAPVAWTIHMTSADCAVRSADVPSEVVRSAVE